MVVITVIIAAIMAVFAFGLGAPAATPTASVKIIGTDITSSNISIQQVGGDALRLSDIKIVVEQTYINGTLAGRSQYDPVTTNATLKFAAGDRLQIATNKSSVLLNNNGVDLVSGGFTGIGTNTLVAGNTVTVSVIYRPTDSVLSQPKVDL